MRWKCCSVIYFSIDNSTYWMLKLFIPRWRYSLIIEYPSLFDNKLLKTLKQNSGRILPFVTRWPCTRNLYKCKSKMKYFIKYCRYIHIIIGSGLAWFMKLDGRCINYQRTITSELWYKHINNIQIKWTIIFIYLESVWRRG